MTTPDHTDRPAESGSTTTLFSRDAMRISEAARYLGVHEATVHRLMAKGALPFVKGVGRTFILRRDLDRLVERHRQVRSPAERPAATGKRRQSAR